MARNQILVHFAAPSTVHDDDKYRMLAESIRDFHPATVTRFKPRFTSTIDTPLQLHLKQPCRNACGAGQNVPVSQSRRLGSNVEQAVGSSFDEVRTALSCSDEAIRPHAAATGSEICPTARCDVSPTATHRGETVQRDGWLLAEPIRPKTAPAAQNRVLVPASSSRKRARSISSSFHSAASNVSDSQLSARVALEKALRMVSRDNSGHSRPAVYLVQPCSSTSSKASHARKKCQRRVSADTLEAEFGTAFDEYAQVLQACNPNTHCFFARDRSLDWTSSECTSAINVASDNTSQVSTTVSPSQAISQTFFSHSLCSCPGQMHNGKTGRTIDLTSYDSVNESTGREERRTTSASLIEPSGMVNEVGTASAVARREETDHVGQQLAALTAHVESPPPPTGFASYQSHITDTLKTVSERLPLERFFKPEYVERDVRGLERGYWQLDVKLADKPTAARTRHPPSRAQLHQKLEQEATAPDRLLGGGEALNVDSDVDAAKQPDIHENVHENLPLTAVWTEHEFCDFWHNLSSIIREGRAGWGVRAVFQTTSLSVSPSPVESTLVKVRVYTWGEVLGHIWLAMWVLSDKLTAYVPMRWIACNGSTVVQMTGSRSRQGRLGPWTYKGPEGERGCWGISG